MVSSRVGSSASCYRGRRQRDGVVGSAASRYWRWASSAALSCLLALAVSASLAQERATPTKAASGRAAQPVIEKARGAQCVAEPAFMRRNHMTLLKHQRDDTLRLGVRHARHSLKACVECHASRSTNSVAASKGDFCQSCHEYAAVSMDCFECHASQPGTGPMAQSLTQVKP